MVAMYITVILNAKSEQQAEKTGQAPVIDGRCTVSIHLQTTSHSIVSCSPDIPGDNLLENKRHAMHRMNARVDKKKLSINRHGKMKQDMCNLNYMT